MKIQKVKNVKSASSKNTTKEIWKNIPGFTGKYQVSNMGRVRSLNHSTQQTIVSCTGVQYTCVKNYAGRILKPCQDNYGYFHVRLYADRKAYLFKLHKLVAMMFLPDFEEDLTVDHINCDKSDNRVQNLQMLSLRENIRIGQQRNNHQLPTYLTSTGETFKKFKIWCKKKGLQFNKYEFYKSIYSGLPYMDSGITFEKIEP